MPLRFCSSYDLQVYEETRDADAAEGFTQLRDTPFAARAKGAPCREELRQAPESSPRGAEL